MIEVVIEWEPQAERLRRSLLSNAPQRATELAPETLMEAIRQGAHGLMWEAIEVDGWQIQASMYRRDTQLWWLVHAHLVRENVTSSGVAHAPSAEDKKLLDQVLEYLGAEPERHAIIRSSCAHCSGRLGLWWTWRNGWLRDQGKIRIERETSEGKA